MLVLTYDPCPTSVNKVFNSNIYRCGHGIMVLVQHLYPMPVLKDVGHTRKERQAYRSQDTCNQCNVNGKLKCILSVKKCWALKNHFNYSFTFLGAQHLNYLSFLVSIGSFIPCPYLQMLLVL